MLAILYIVSMAVALVVGFVFGYIRGYIVGKDETIAQLDRRNGAR